MESNSFHNILFAIRIIFITVAIYLIMYRYTRGYTHSKSETYCTLNSTLQLEKGIIKLHNNHLTVQDYISRYENLNRNQNEYLDSSEAQDSIISQFENLIFPEYEIYFYNQLYIASDIISPYTDLNTILKTVYSNNYIFHIVNVILNKLPTLDDKLPIFKPQYVKKQEITHSQITKMQIHALREHYYFTSVLLSILKLQWSRLKNHLILNRIRFLFNMLWNRLDVLLMSRHITIQRFQIWQDNLENRLKMIIIYKNNELLNGLEYLTVYLLVNEKEIINEFENYKDYKEITKFFYNKRNEFKDINRLKMSLYKVFETVENKMENFNLKQIKDYFLSLSYELKKLKRYIHENN